MNRLFLLFISLLIAYNSQAQINQNLFNTKDLSGWYAFDVVNGKYADASKRFRVEKKMIRLYGKKPGFLMSEKSFAEFILVAKFRWNTDSVVTRGSNKKNSGLMYLIPESTQDTLWPKGIQFQIKEGATGDFVLLKNVTIEQNGIKSMPGPSISINRIKENENEVGEWNSIKIIVSKGKVLQFLNGELVNQGNNPSVNTGRILLQYEGYPIDFKDIKIRNLKNHNLH